MTMIGKDCAYSSTDPFAVSDLELTQLLVVGRPKAEDHALAREVRSVKQPPIGLEVRGWFAFRQGAAWHGVLVREGREETTATFSSRQLEDDHWCAQTRSWMQFLWDSATPVVEATRFVLGDQVQLVGSDRVGFVRTATRVDGRSAYEVWFGAGDSRTLGDESLEPFVIDETQPATWIRAGTAPFDDFARTLTYTKLSQALTDTVYSYRSSRTIHRPYQFRPVLRMIDGGPQRLLIADEVGLGKTIEAGLIWNELEQRTDLRRVLVVCPATLVHKWQAEMERRFDRRLTALDRAGFKELVHKVQSGDGDTPVSAVMSLEMLRNSPDLEALTKAQPRFDLVIVDEAHYLRNPGTRSHTLGQLLGDWAEALVFLSATPLNLGSDDLFSLMHLLRPETFEERRLFAQQIEPNRHLSAAASMLLASKDEPRKVASVVRRVESLAFAGSVRQRLEYDQLLELLEQDRPLDWQQVGQARRLLLELNVLSGALTRTRKVDVPDAKAVREPVQLDVHWSSQERDLYDAVVTAYRAKAKRSRTPAAFIMQMPLRQAASCLPATAQWLHERHGGGGWASIVDDGVSDADRAADLPDAQDDLDGDDLAVLFTAARKLGPDDTKFDRLHEALVEAQRQGLPQVMVFSFFRRTLHYLERRLAGDFRVRVMHGGTPMADRPEIIDSFRRGDFDILLVSEVGSEGLDFEFCNVLVNYDLPWNPMRVEQRIGRLDRFGQQHEKIFIYNFHVPGTIETDIFERLYNRIGVFRDSIGELEPILREETNDVAAIVLDPVLTESQRKRRLAELEVAWSDREHDLGRLRESEGLLAGLDDLLVDGLERDLNERGRFIGADELRQLVRDLVKATGGRTSMDSDDAAGLIVKGTDELAALLTADRAGGSSRMGLAELKHACYYNRPFPVTFDGEGAGAGNREYVGVRHPLVRAAVTRLRRAKSPLPRYAVLGVRGLQMSSPVLVLLLLAETTGLRPRLELLPVAQDLQTMEPRDDVGFSLLQALTDGGLTPMESESPVGLVLDALSEAQRRAEAQRFAWERERSTANAALVEARVASQTAAIDIKLGQARQTLRTVAGKDERIVRLNESRVRNLSGRRHEVQDELASKRSLAVTLRPVAVALVVPG